MTWRPERRRHHGADQKRLQTVMSGRIIATAVNLPALLQEGRLRQGNRISLGQHGGQESFAQGGAPRGSTKRGWDNVFRCTLNAGTFPVTPT